MEALKPLQARGARRVLLAWYDVLQPVLTKTSCGTVRQLICVSVSLPHFTFENNSVSSLCSLILVKDENTSQHYFFFQIKYEAKSQLKML